jgi:septum formation protein
VTEVAAKPPGYLVLASASPQRSAILTQLGIAFEVMPADIEEHADGDPREAVLGNALRKARAVARRVGPGRDVLGVDTEVLLDGRLLGKADDERHARAHLEALSGRTHEVLSGVALLHDGGESTTVVRTTVAFRELDDRLVEWYLAGGEWRGRAGAYAVQGQGAALVASIGGDPWNVVGLPVAALLDMAPWLLPEKPDFPATHASASST